MRTGPADQGDASNDHTQRQQVVHMLFSFQEYYRKECSDNYNRPAKHLIHRSSRLRQPNVHQGRARQIARGRNSEPDRIDFGLQLNIMGNFGSGRARYKLLIVILRSVQLGLDCVVQFSAQV